MLARIECYDKPAIPPTQERQQIWAGEIQPTFCIISTQWVVCQLLGGGGKNSNLTKKKCCTLCKHTVPWCWMKWVTSVWSCLMIYNHLKTSVTIMNLLWGNSSHMHGFAIMLKLCITPSTFFTMNSRIRLHFQSIYSDASLVAPCSGSWRFNQTALFLFWQIEATQFVKNVQVQTRQV